MVSRGADNDSLEFSRDFWNAAAEKYERAFTGTSVGKFWRSAVWRELDARFRPGCRILELNCGTGLDAIHLARRGVSVVAYDISPRMIDLARQAATGAPGSELLDFRVLATEHLTALNGEPQFEGAFSNFSGLNCVQDLSAVGGNLARLLVPGSALLLCMLGRIWPLGSLWRLLHGPRKRPGRPAKNSTVCVYHPSSREIAGALSPYFVLRRLKGVGITVPPSYMEPLAVRFPRSTHLLDTIDRLVCDLPPFRSLGGCVLLEFKRTSYQGDLHGPAS
jgi:SAM-dependent methyltransferase